MGVIVLGVVRLAGALADPDAPSAPAAGVSAVVAGCWVGDVVVGLVIIPSAYPYRPWAFNALVMCLFTAVHVVFTPPSNFWSSVFRQEGE